MHYHHVADPSGDITDLIPFCSDACHRDWCAETGASYEGWNGCHEGPDYPAFCASCGVFAGDAPQCECQAYNVVVNRFRCDAPEICEHGNFLQVPV